MDIIDDINTFKELYGNANNNASILSKYRLSLDVLENYLENYDDVNWSLVSSCQILSESLIDKYVEYINFKAFFILNDNTKPSYKLLSKYLYWFNLYEMRCLAINNTKNNIILIGIIDRLVKDNPHKYKIDKLSYEIN